MQTTLTYWAIIPFSYFIPLKPEIKAANYYGTLHRQTDFFFRSNAAGVEIVSRNNKHISHVQIFRHMHSKSDQQPTKDKVRLIVTNCVYVDQTCEYAQAGPEVIRRFRARLS